MAFTPNRDVRHVCRGYGADRSVQLFAHARAPEPEPAPATEGMPKAAPAAPTPTTEERYDLKLRELEEKVVSLKEKIFRSRPD